MLNKRFKHKIDEFSKQKKEIRRAQHEFKIDIINFMAERDLSVNVLFFGSTFGIETKTPPNESVPSLHRIPLSVLNDFCNHFGCTFQCTACEGHRYIFYFDNIDDIGDDLLRGSSI